MQVSVISIARRCTAAIVFLGIFGLLAGCEANDFAGPSEPYIQSPSFGRSTVDPLQVPIVDTVAPGIEEPSSQFSGATDVRPEDLVPIVEDYTIGVNDVVSVGIMDLQGEGTGEVIKQVRVTETGNISLPYVSPVHADGLTERQLQDAVVAAYENAKMIQHANVTVTVDVARQRTYKIQENVVNPGEYSIDKPEYRMLDALVAARAPATPIGVPYAYVFRKPPQAHSYVPPTIENGGAPATQPATNPGDLLNPQGRANPVGGQPILADDMATGGSGASTQPFAFNNATPDASGIVRVIRVPIYDLLQNGELKYNIVIRPGDMIVVPNPEQGVYYVGGHVIRPGAFSLSGTKVTVKQAWVAAGGADVLAEPSRSEIIRRVGDSKEVFVRVNMSKVWAGEEPDVFLKPDDLVEVGTSFWAPFIQLVRNAPSLSTGVGLSYQRNFYTGVNPL